ncbi:MAG: efflux RND transporter periplasmic adaptor subunit [Planctomycetota bacterium]|nr:efflux RND transporter periplasmic adaptor subunit [Planctomycetota bacterium]
MKYELLSRTLRPHRPKFDRHGGLVGALLVCLILVGVFGAIGYKVIYRETGIADGDLITAVAMKGAFDHIVLEQGEIESSSNINVTCQVQSRGMGGVTILWVIDEGTKVKEGDKLVEIDSSELELQLKEKKIRVISAEAAVTTAEANVEQAKIARQEYLDGVYQTERKQLLSDQAIAQQELRKAQLISESSERLVAKGLLKSLQLEADQYAVANNQNKYDAATQKLEVLETLTKKKMLVGFDSDIEAADANLSAAQAELVEEQTELAEIEEQVSKCVMYAPADGVVVHANRYSSRGGNAEFVVEAGSQVRERQEIIKLPDPNAMQVKCKINESRITLVREGMAARISVDAIPGLTLTGRVKKVNRYAEPSSFFSSSIKEYATIVEIIDPPESIRTGMTAEVQIFVEQLDDALQVPIQALYEHGDEMYVLTKNGPTEFATSRIKIGATNDTMASIDEGLEENGVVVLNLRDHLSLMDLPEIERQDNSDMRDVASEVTTAADGGEPAADRGGRPGGGGRPGAGGRPGGGAGCGGFDMNSIVTRIMEGNDTDGDGVISAEEIKAMDPNRSSMVKMADSNGDGNVTRAEMTKAMSSRMGSGGRPGGGGGFGGGAGGRGPRQ